jgi:hypothetical protein
MSGFGCMYNPSVDVTIVLGHILTAPESVTPKRFYFLLLQKQQYFNI